tara:strand:- start:332 stop:697 length:366 start_codon:yes stop_codon:yes gene_type:complete
MRDKKKLTKTLIALHFDGSTESSLDYKTALHSWWYNTRDTGGMRLTSTGFQILKRLKFEYWDFELPDNFARKNKRIILGLDRKLQFPYFYGQKRLSFFGSQEAMMANLTGDLEGWLANNFS